VSTVGSFQELIALLDEGKVMHRSDPESSAVQILTEQRGVEGMQVIRWQELDGVLQFIQSVPLTAPAERIAAVAEAVARLNHALAIPGLDYDQDRNLLAFRTYLPIFPRGAVGGDEVQAMFRITVKTAVDLLPTLRRVCEGDIAPADVLADAQRELSQSTVTPS
jgi:hypothetical protein